MLRNLVSTIIQVLASLSLFRYWRSGKIFVSERIGVVSTESWGTLLRFNNDDLSPLYLVAPSALHSSLENHGASNHREFVLCTSIHVESNSSVSSQVLAKKFSLFAQIDDVWRQEFLEGIILVNQGPGNATLNDATLAWLADLSVKYLYITSNIEVPVSENIKVTSIERAPPTGPYMVGITHTQPEEVNVFDVYRLYEDKYDGFLFGSIPNPSSPGGWILTNATFPSSFDPETKVQYIPVASRLPALSSSLPLAGRRFALKDIFDAQGLPTSAGSIAYAAVHPIPNETSPSVHSLLSLGAHMVGKTRTSQFAHGAHPWEYVDVPYSWNPRGDGLLTAAASSSGSACAVAGYEWLDFTVGSDTRGSVRKPAALVGVYGIRPSHGSLDLTGVVPLSEEMDTAGIFARDPISFCRTARLWYHDSLNQDKRIRTEFPSKILYPIDHFPVKNQKAQIIYNNFFQALQDRLSIMKIPVNFTDILIPHFPNGNFTEFQLSSNRLAEYRSWISVGQPIVEAYRSSFHREPVFDPIPAKVFSRAKNITVDAFNEAVQLKGMFRDAVSNHIFKENPVSCADSIFVYDAATGGLPSYRVEDFNFLLGATPFLLTAAHMNQEPRAADFFNFVASMAELPEITVPIGQVRYFSQLTRTWEDLPIAVQFVTRKGCDGMLLDLVEKMATEGIISSVKVGPSAF